MPSNSLYKETLSKKRQVMCEKTTGKPRFAMLPEDVLADIRLTPAAKLVLAGMSMMSFQSGRISISHQALGEVCGLSRSAVLTSVKALARFGLIEPDGAAVRQVQPYKLLHSRLASVSQVSSQVVVDKRNAGKMVACPTCHKSRKQLLKAGWCRSCAWELRVRGLAREEIASAS
jgi:hypothetical protein